MEYSNEQIGKNIRSLRKKRRLTMNELAPVAGIGPSYMGLVERGQRRLSADKLLRLCAFFGVSLDYMITRDLTGLAFPVAMEDNEPYESEDELRLQIDNFLSGASVEELRLALNVMSDIKTYSTYGVGVKRERKSAGNKDESKGKY